MLLEKETRNLESAGVMQVARATIKTSPKIFNFFADATYANKPRAICRELVANAFDSHVMAGKGDVPVEVWLPTLLDPVFRVKDEGLGMSHAFMMGQFMCYADGSTKDSENIAIGGFGIGSKSPFAYVDQYTVTSVFEGTESVYTIFKDEDGIPAIGLLGQRPSNRANGVEVSFPVKPDDFTKFEEAAFEALRYFEPLPKIVNATEGSFTPPAYVSKGKTWGMRSDAGDMAIIMGGIRYPVETSNLLYKIDREGPAGKLLQYGIDLRVPIGTCSVALSREALSYDDRTIAAIEKACEDVIEEVADTFANMFDQYDSRWEAAKALYRETNGDRYSSRAKFLIEHAKWHGQPLSTKIDFPKLLKRQDSLDPNVTNHLFGYAYWSIGSKDSRRSRRSKTGYADIGSAKWDSPDKHGIEPGAIHTLVIDNLPQTPKFKAVKKIKIFAEELEEPVLVIRPWDEEGNIDVEAVIKGFGDVPEDRIVLTSDLPEPIVERQKYARGDRPFVRMFRYNGYDFTGYNWRENKNNINPGRWGKTGVEEIKYEDQPDSGILVTMNAFEIPRSDIQQKVNTGLLTWEELLFVNVGDAKKLKGFEDYTKAFERRKKEALSEYPELPKRLALENSCLNYLFEFFRRHPGVDFSAPRKPLAQVFNLYKQYIEPLTADQRKLAALVEEKLPAGVKPDELFEKFKTKQWKAFRLIQCLSNVMDEEDMKILQENL